MSASTDRKKRQEAIANGTDKKTIAMQEEAAKKKKENRKWTIGGIIVALLIAAILLANSNFFYTKTPAVKVGSTGYSAAQMDFYYRTQYLNFMNQYGSYASMFGLDSSKSLKDQECTMSEDGGSWYDYFMQQAVDYVKQVTAYTKYAKENDIELDEDSLKLIDDQMTSFETEANSQGFSSVDKYLESVYGKGCNSKIIRQEMEKVSLASKVIEEVQDSFEYSDEELTKYYNEHKDDYDNYSYAYYLVNAEQEPTASAEDGSSVEEEAAEAETAVTDETMAVAKKHADAIAAAVTGTGNLTAAVQAEMGDTTLEAVTQNAVQGSNLPADYADWMKDASRAAGDKTVVESEGTGYYVVVYGSRDANNYHMASVRHILIQAQADENGEYTEEALATAKATLDGIYQEWQNGEKTEDSFAALAQKYSEDSGSASTGGLYDSVYKGEMVPEFDAWCFDASRKPGDTGIVKGESSSYAGYHLIYYVGQGDLYSKYLAETALVQDNLQKWQDKQTKGFDVKEMFSKKFIQA